MYVSSKNSPISCTGRANKSAPSKNKIITNISHKFDFRNTLGETWCNVTLNAFFSFLFVVRIWDVRPFAPAERCVKLFQGAQHNFEKVRTEQYIGDLR